MKNFLALVMPIVLGVLSYYVASYFGYASLDTWQHWSFFLMMTVPFVIGLQLGQGR